MRINSGIHKGRVLQVPKGRMVRPTVTKLKQAVFNICGTHLDGASFLDLFAGAGGMGLEALSRGAASSTLIEQGKEALACIRKNITLLREEKRARLLPSDVFDGLKRLSKRGETFDIIFADPPYGKGLSLQVLQEVERLALLKRGGELFLEDGMEVLKEEVPPTCFTLQSERRMGDSLLRHYIYE